MEQPRKDIGTRKDLVLYRLQTAKADLKSARILLAAEEYKGVENLINVIKMPLLILIRSMSRMIFFPER